MKKKSLLMVLSVFASAAAVTAVGCGHEHDWKLKSNSDAHWYECSEEGEQKDYGVHVDGNADGKCDVCAADVHIHDYSWKSDEGFHWQECVYGETTSRGYHIDEDGDYHCDTCDYVEKISVKFDMGGLIPDEETQVDKGDRVTAPEAPKGDGVTFAGWYTDSAKLEEYDFTTPVTESLTLYAKWDETDENGANLGHAYTLSLETESFQTFGNKNYMYFSYTASMTGRYTVWVLGATNCTYALGKDKFVTVYDNDAMPHFDLDAGETLYVKLFKAEGLANDALAGIYISEVKHEEVPESWLDGDYVCANQTVTLNIKNQTIAYSDVNGGVPLPFNYLGGKLNYMTFELETLKLTYMFKQNADGTYTLSRNGTALADFKYYVAEEKVSIDKFDGRFVAAGDKLDGIDSFNIDSEGTGFYYKGTTKSDVYTVDRYPNEFYAKSSTICYYAKYYITANLDSNGNTVSISVKNSLSGKQYVYTRTGDGVPAKLPLSTGVTYYGENNTLYGDSFGFQLNEFGYNLVIDSYVASENKYEVHADNRRYVFVIEGTGDDAVVKLLDANGGVTDELSIVVPDYQELSFGASAQTVTLNTSDFVRGKFYYYKVAAEGYYDFTAGTDGLKIYYGGGSLETPLTKGTALDVSSDADKKNILLKEGTVVMVSIEDLENVPATVSFTLKEGLPPKGLEESNPVSVDASSGMVSYDADSREKLNYVYVEFTDLKPGKYYLNASYKDDDGVARYFVHYLIDGEMYGATYNASSWKWEWHGGLSASNTNALITVGEGVTKLAVAAAPSNSTAAITLKLWEDPLNNATGLTFDGESKGSLTQTGNYKAESLADYTKSVSVTFTSDSAFTIYVNGVENTVTKLTLTKDQLKNGFRFEAPADGKSVNYVLDYELGAQQNPYKFSKLGNNTVKLAAGQLTYVELDLSNYKLNNDFVLGFGSAASNQLYYFQLNGTGTKYGYGITGNEMKPLENVSCKYVVTDEASKKVLLVVGSDSPAASNNYLTLSFTVDVTSNATEVSFTDIPIGESQVSFADTEVANGKNLVIKKKADATMVLSSSKAFTLLFTDGTTSVAKFKNGNYVIDNLKVTGTSDAYFRVLTEGSVQLVIATTYMRGSQAYPYIASFENGSCSFSLATGSSFVVLEAGTYTFTYSYTVSVDGTTVQKGKSVTFDEQTVVCFTGTRAATATVKYAVPEDFHKEFVYTDNNGEQVVFNVGLTSFTLNNLTYTLTGANGNEYTFKSNGADENTVTLTLGSTLKFNDYEMEIYVPEIFTAEQAGKYVDTTVFFGTTMYVQFDVEGKGEMLLVDTNTLSAVKHTITKTKVNAGGTYTLVADKLSVTFSFTATGATLTANGLGTRNLVKSYMFTAEQAGNYGTTLFSKNVSFKIDRNGKGELNMIDGNMNLVKSTFDSVTDKGDGTYSLTAENGEVQFAFAANGNVMFTKIPGFGMTVTMEKMHMFTEAQAGTYTGSFFGDVALTFDVDGVGSMTLPLDPSNPTAGNSTETFTSITDNGNGTFGINGKVTFKFTDAGIQVTKIPSGGATVNLTKQVAQGSALAEGTYTGTSNFDLEITLVVNSNNTVTFTFEMDGDANTYNNLALTVQGDGYTFTYGEGFDATTVTLTVNADGTLSFSDSWGDGGTLEKS